MTFDLWSHQKIVHPQTLFSLLYGKLLLGDQAVSMHMMYTMSAIADVAGLALILGVIVDKLKTHCIHL